MYIATKVGICPPRLFTIQYNKLIYFESNFENMTEQVISFKLKH